jgi:hypothetical protein
MTTLEEMNVIVGQLNAFEVAYKELQEIQLKLKDIEDRTKAIYEYTPLSFANDIEYKLHAARTALIKWCAEKLRAVVTPMASLDKHDFVKMMDELLGNDTDFSTVGLVAFFKTLIENHVAVQNLSIETILKRVRKFLPYSNSSGQWDIETNAEALMEKGNALLLHCSTWRGATLSWSMNDEHQFNALHKAIEVALFQADPATVERYTQITDHVTKVREPEAFYKTVTIVHPAIARFRFFKNNTFRIWFTNRDWALRAAKFLTGGQPQ